MSRRIDTLAFRYLRRQKTAALAYELTEKRSASEKEAGGSAREEPPASDEFNLTGGLWHPL